VYKIIIRELYHENQLFMNRDKITLPNTLTKRESEILIEIQDGMLSKQIAAELHISKRTVDTLRRNILKKYQVRNIAEAIEAIKQFSANKQ
jgi:DNA-binding NarL/FixJ family response regulator